LLLVDNFDASVLRKFPGAGVTVQFPGKEYVQKTGKTGVPLFYEIILN
jgi:hypothetical protein